jgi:hypothetical protein
VQDVKEVPGRPGLPTWRKRKRSAQYSHLYVDICWPLILCSREHREVVSARIHILYSRSTPYMFIQLRSFRQLHVLAKSDVDPMA